jgi:hypothetical protein
MVLGIAEDETRFPVADSFAGTDIGSGDIALANQANLHYHQGTGPSRDLKNPD